MDLPSDLIDLLAAFADTKAEYLLVGGHAVALHGVPRFTKDSDLWLRNDEQNLERVQKALRVFGAPASTIQALATAQGLDVVWMGYPPSRIDLMKTVPGGDFESAWQSHAVFHFDGVPLRCVSRPYLIELKQASGRPQDLMDVEALRKAAEE